MTPAATQALQMVRDPTHFKWHAVALLAFVFYVYGVEVERRNWRAVLAGLAFWAVDWINEVANAVILHVTGYAPLWATTGKTAYQLLVGLNVEIAVLFAVNGIVFTKFLPKDPAVRWLGVPNRWLLVAGFSCFSVLVEVFLVSTGTFHWAYPFWNLPHLELIVLFGYSTFYIAAVWVYDAPTHAARLRIAGGLWGVAVTALGVFGALGWI